jgi:hypothetical protein
MVCMPLCRVHTSFQIYSCNSLFIEGLSLLIWSFGGLHLSNRQQFALTERKSADVIAGMAGVLQSD